MKKIKLYLFYIVTFGVGFFVLKNKAKKHALIINEELTTSNNIPFKVEELIQSFGGKENIQEISSNINSIKIMIKNIELIDQNQIKKFNPKGLIVSENSIICLFGDFSQKLEKEINFLIK